MSEDFRTRRTAVTDKILLKVPPTQGKVVSAIYDFSVNEFKLYNPYQYTIGFLETLNFEEVCSKIKSELPEPASAIHVRTTRVMLYFIVLPIMGFMTYQMANKFMNSEKDVRVLEAMLWCMYVFMAILALMVHYTYRKNMYFDRMHKREKIMKAILQEVNDTFYPRRDVIWQAGKYGLFFYGQLRNRKSKREIT